MTNEADFVELSDAQLEEVKYVRQYALEMSKERFDTVKRAINLAFIINSGGLVSIPVFIEGDMSNLYKGAVYFSVFLFISGIVHSFRCFRSYWQLADGFDALSQRALCQKKEEEARLLDLANDKYKSAHDKCGGAVYLFLISCIWLIFALTFFIN